MSSLLFLYGTAEENALYIGEPSQITIDTVTLVMAVHDGETPGGNAVLKLTGVSSLLGGELTSHINSGDHDLRYYRKFEVLDFLDNKVDKVTGKALTEEEFTTALKNKLEGIETGAEVNLPTTDSRTDDSTTTVLQAKALYDHSSSADHDTRYYTKVESTGLLDTKVNYTDVGVANGISSLDHNAKVPLYQINDAVLGQVSYQGVWNANSNSPTLPIDPSEEVNGLKGDYYVVANPGNFAGIDFEIGDWIISNGSVWEKVDNTDAVSSVAGRTGNVILTKNDVGLNNVDNTSDSAKPISTAQQSALDTKVDKVVNKGLSTEDYTTTEKSKLASIEPGAEVNQVLSVAGRTGNVLVTKTDVGLSNVQNIDTTNAANLSTGILPEGRFTDISHGTRLGGNAHALATTTIHGFMSATDKAKLNSIEPGAGVNEATDLSIDSTAEQITLTSSTGNSVIFLASSQTLAGLMSASQTSKLDGIQAGAQVNTVLSVAGRAGDVVLSKGDVGLSNVQNVDSTNASNLVTGLLPAERFNNTAHGARSGGNLHDVATVSNAGFMSTAQVSKLEGIQSGAQVNPTSTASRSNGSITTVLQAKAMLDHVTEGDHALATETDPGFMSPGDKAKVTATPNFHVSTDAPDDNIGVDGDIWLRYQ